jgi:hypothetical protein
MSCLAGCLPDCKPEFQKKAESLEEQKSFLGENESLRRKQQIKVDIQRRIDYDKNQRQNECSNLQEAWEEKDE